MNNTSEWLYNIISHPLFITLFSGGGIVFFGFVLKYMRKKSKKKRKLKNEIDQHRVDNIPSKKIPASKITDDSKYIEKTFIEKTKEEKSIEYFHEGRCFYDEKKYGLAIECFSRSISIDEKNIHAFFYRGKALLYKYLEKSEMDYLNDAIRDFEAVLNINPNHVEAHKNLADIFRMRYEKSNNDLDLYKRAIKEYDKANLLEKERKTNLDNRSLSIPEIEILMGRGKLNYARYKNEIHRDSDILGDESYLTIGVSDFTKIIQEHRTKKISHAYLFEAYLYKGHLHYYEATNYLNKYNNIEIYNHGISNKLKYQTAKQAAINSYQDAIGINPRRTDLYLYKLCASGKESGIHGFIWQVPTRNDYIELKKNADITGFRIPIQIDNLIMEKYYIIEETEKKKEQQKIQKTY